MTKLMTKLIAHRGNISGPQVKFENSPGYLKDAIFAGYDVEVDIWLDNIGFSLGHDEGTYHVTKSFINEITPHAWFHCKNYNAFNYFLLNYNDNIYASHFFTHDQDQYAPVLSKIYTGIVVENIWCYPGTSVPDDIGILVMPETLNVIDFHKAIKQNIYGICSDNVELIKKLLT